MQKNNGSLDDYSIEEEFELYSERTSAISSQKKKLKARRQIEEIRENKRLQREIDSYFYD